MDFNPKVFEIFKYKFNQDSAFIKDWMVNWTYQDVRKKRKVNYKGDLPEDFYTFEKPEDIIEWMNWLKSDKKDTFKPDIIDPLIERSTEFDKAFFTSNTP